MRSIARTFSVLALLLALAWPSSAHLIKLHVAHELEGAPRQALLEMFEAYNSQPGHGAVIRSHDGGDEIVDVIVQEAEAIDPGAVLPLDEWLDLETGASFVEGVLDRVRQDGLLLGLPLSADALLVASVARDADDPHEAYALVRFLAGATAGRILAQRTGLQPAHGAALMMFEAPAASHDLRVMSFNIRYGTAADGPNSWDQRAPLVAQVIGGFAPDLLGTQECLAFQRDALAAALPGYAVVGVGRDDGAEGGEMCAGFYRRDRFEMLDHGTFWLSETPTVVASRGWDAALARIATWLRLRDRATGREILWLNAHFDHRGAAARRESAALIHRWLGEHRGDAATLVVTGDFNAPANDDAKSTHKVLRCGYEDEPRLVDTWTAVHGGPGDPAATGTYHGFEDQARPGRIDWVLTDVATSVLKADILRHREAGRWPSDHFPVTAILRLP